MDWWSAPLGGPHPSSGIQLSPSSSVTADMLQPSVSTPRLFAAAGVINCETMVRPVLLSVNKIGSIVIRLVQRKLLSSHVALAGTVESSNVARRVCSSAMNITRPVFQLTPIVGSPALLPRLPLAAKL